jgi:AraC-like DNA-binding protein
MKTKHLICLIALIVATSNTFAKNAIDSLTKNSENSKDIESKYRATEELAFYYFEEAHNITAAITTFNQAKIIALELGDIDKYADMNNYLGICYETIGMHDSAIIYFKILLDVSINQKNNNGITNAYKNLGLVYEFSGDYENAINNYILLAQIADEINDTILLIDSYLNIGSIYRSINQLKQSEEHITNALELNNFIEDDLMYARIYNQLAMIEKIKGVYEKAITHYLNSLKFSENIKWDKGIAAAYSNLGNVYIELEKYEEALEYHLKSLEIEKELDHFYGIRVSMNSISNIYLAINKIDLAKDYATDAYKMAKSENNYEGMAESIRYLFEISLIEGNIEIAQEYFNEYETCMDSVYSIESLEKIKEIETKYQTEKRKQKITFLSIQNELEKDKNSRRLTFIFILSFSLLVVIILSIFLFRLYLQKQNAYKTLVNLNIQAANCDQHSAQVNTGKKESEQFDELANTLNDYMIEAKPFLNQDLTIDKLAKSLNTNRQYVSKTINTYFSKNFSSYINEFKVKEARKLLLDKDFDKYTMEAIALKCGFSNRTSFISAFKKYTGVTPSYFKSNSRTD